MPTIVFSHANGFPAGTYRVLFDTWKAAGFEVQAVDKYGHDPRYPVTSNWPRLTDQLIDLLKREVGHPAFLVGHSLGGFVSLMAALKRPDLALGVVLLDSPVIAGWKARGLQLVKATGLIGRMGPGSVSQRRREAWADSAEAHGHFAKKAAFKRWDPRVLEDYIETGIEDAGTRHTLSFKRDIETRIYNTLPHHLPRLIRRQSQRVATAFIGGTESSEVQQVGLAATHRTTDGRISWIEGSHLFPFERPTETAEEVLRWIDVLGAATSGRSGPIDLAA